MRSATPARPVASVSTVNWTTASSLMAGLAGLRTAPDIFFRTSARRFSSAAVQAAFAYLQFDLFELLIAAGIVFGGGLGTLEAAESL